MTAHSALRFEQLAPNIGARVTGVDLSLPLNEVAFGAIRQAFLDHLLLLFPGQNLPPPAQIAFTERFGAVEAHPLKARAGHPEYDNLLVLENRPERRGARNDFWHSDITCALTPPAATLLHAIEVPEGRGDTSFCNMYRAWQLLPDDLRRRLDGIGAWHSGEAIRKRNQAADTDGNKQMPVPPPELHPVARRHPETGRRALYVNRFFTTHFDGMDAAESTAILERCEKIAITPDNVYRHRWRAGDVLMWDNRCTMHYADYDYAPTDIRLMHRTTAAGDRPAA